METKKYPSRYNPGKSISPTHYIVELICEHNARYTKKEIPVKFWTLPEWGQFYRFQLKRAKQLLEHYSDEAIIKALNDKRSYNIWSLQAKWLIPIIKDHQASVDKQEQLNNMPPKEKAPEMTGTEFKRESFKNKRNILEELDG